MGVIRGGTVVSTTLVFCVLSALGVTAAVYERDFRFVPSAAALPWIALALVAAVIAIWHSRSDSLLAVSPGRARCTPAITLALCAIIAAHLFVTIPMLRAGPPVIDTYRFERDAAAALLHGTDPYTITHEDIYQGKHPEWYPPGVADGSRVHVGFTYPPINILFVIPGYLAGDVRYAYDLALVLTAVLMVAANPGLFSLLAAAAVLLSPVTGLVLYKSWTEPLMLVTFCATVYAALHKKALLPVALGIFLATKQYSVLVLPLAALLLERFTWKEYGRLILRALAVAAIFTLPFALWDLPHFLHDTVQYYSRLPIRGDALSLSAVLVSHGLRPVPLWLSLLGAALCIVWCLRRARPHPALFATASAIAITVFFALGTAAFANYYFLVIGMLAMAACAVPQGSTGVSPATLHCRQADEVATVSSR